MRYVYDRTTWLKKKLKTEIAIEPSIAVPRHRGADGPGGAADPEYELAAVLIHRGASAHGGHYVARVRDWRPAAEAGAEGAQRWWLFDDAVVSPVEGASRADARDPKGAEPADDAPPLDGDGARAKGKGGAKGAKGGAAKKKPAAGPAGALGAEPSDAYMLVYVRSDFLREHGASEVKVGVLERARRRRGRGEGRHDETKGNDDAPPRLLSARSCPRMSGVSFGARTTSSTARSSVGTSSARTPCRARRRANWNTASSSAEARTEGRRPRSARPAQDGRRRRPRAPTTSSG